MPAGTIGEKYDRASPGCGKKTAWPSLRWPPPGSVDLVLTDFPYLSDSPAADYDVLSPDHWPQIWTEIFRVLKPGRRVYLWANNEETLAPIRKAMWGVGFKPVRAEEKTGAHEWVKVTKSGKIRQAGPPNVLSSLQE